ncbi:Uncharacterised protein [Alistipes sp. cv1]|nr:Uncharacterised protein [Faecalibacterium prausnitzii]
MDFLLFNIGKDAFQKGRPLLPIALSCITTRQTATAHSAPLSKKSNLSGRRYRQPIDEAIRRSIRRMMIR